MKLNRIVKIAVIPVFTAFYLMFTSNLAMAEDYMTLDGSYGNYRYEVWTDGNNSFYLKVWLKEASSDSAPIEITKKFGYTKDAIAYFESHYEK
jgi:hypothetical protein